MKSGLKPTQSKLVRPDASRRRAFVVAIFLAFWMVVIGARLVYLQTSQYEFLSTRARAQQQGLIDVNAPVRGQILDRTGRELARSIDTDSFFAAPDEIADADAAAQRLAPLLETDASKLAARLKEAKQARRQFVWLARKLDVERGAEIRALDIRGVHGLKESKRRYPNGALAAHVLGFVGLDEGGLGGVEQFHNASLKGAGGKLLMEADARRKSYDSVENSARPGQSVVLTIDQTVQYRTEQVLAAAVERARAKSGSAIILDPRTGEILALANAPTFDPNEANKIPPEARANEALQNIYEPGSTFKIVAYSAAIEEKLGKPEDRIDCQMGSINVFGRIVHDHTAYGSLTLTEALAKSSNVAAIKLGMRVGNARMYDYIRRFGFGAKTEVELPGETLGLLRRVEKWHPSSIGSIAIGQEIGVTPLQMAAAFATIANDGVRVAPHLVREVRSADGAPVEQSKPEERRVISTETAQSIRQMLESVTVKGTAKLAQLDGYTAAGKTGTAQKIDPKTRAYSKTKHVASFVGFAPVTNPSVVIIVVVDEPVGAYHGGDVAAPIFREIAEYVLPYLNVTPDAEFKPAPTQNESLLLARGASSRQADKTNDGATAESVESVSVGLPEVARVGVGDAGEVVFAEAGERALLMPNLRGRSVRDAARICAQLGLELEARGEGRALRQSPAAGASVEAGLMVRVEFGRSD
ncbi:MAG TPA: penicillin-binding protein [Pyrinomonadaceae bacterium]|jgi:cell division protein FtsI (penicillin-binding protein 3)